MKYILLFIIIMASKSTKKDLFESCSQSSQSTRVSFELDINDVTDDDCKDNFAAPAKPMKKKRGISSLPTDTVASKKFKPTESVIQPDVSLTAIINGKGY